MTTLERSTVGSGCACSFAAAGKLHDRLVAFESMGPVEAATLIAQIIGNEDSYTAGCEGDWWAEDDPDEFERFVLEHNWRDPVAMANLVGEVRYAANQAYAHRLLGRAGNG